MIHMKEICWERISMHEKYILFYQQKAAVLAQFVGMIDVYSDQHQL